MQSDETNSPTMLHLDRRAVAKMLVASCAALVLGGITSGASATEIPLERNGRRAWPFQLCFLHWMEDADERLRRRIVTGEWRSPFEFRFDVGGSALRGRANEHNLAVDAYDGDDVWDTVADFDVDPQRTARGWVCGDCAPAERRVFETREDLWRDHLFEPLLAWINETLAPADALALFGSVDSISQARLVAGAEAAVGATKGVAADLDARGGALSVALVVVCNSARRTRRGPSPRRVVALRKVPEPGATAWLVRQSERNASQEGDAIA